MLVTTEGARIGRALKPEQKGETMNAVLKETTQDADRYARCIEVSKRIRWDIERDVIKGRKFDYSRKFLPDGLSKVNSLEFLTEGDAKFLSHVQGRTYSYIFGLVERFINAKVLELSRDHWLGDQTKLEALVRFSDEELKHQEMFRRLEEMMAADMPGGYQLTADANAVAGAVLSKSTWAVLALTCHIELFTQVHYKQSIDAEANICDLWKDVFLYHWKEESQHAILDELEWAREDAKLSDTDRDQAVTDLIELVGAVDGILQGQASADAEYFLSHVTGEYSDSEIEQIRALILDAYRWQYIVSGVQVERFQQELFGKLNEAQQQRILNALAPLLQ